MLHALLVEPLGQIVRHVTRTIVAEKPWPVRDGDVVKAGYSECLVEGWL
ncbi:DNA mismatch repair ATPase MutS [Bradyrhizobium ottawaense]